MNKTLVSTYSNIESYCKILNITHIVKRKTTFAIGNKNVFS